MGQSTIETDSGGTDSGTVGGTPSLKALARLLLARDKMRDTHRDSGAFPPGSGVPPPGQRAGQGGAVSAGVPHAVPPCPATAAALLRHLRGHLRCRVTLRDGLLMIGPAHRCPPPVLAAVLAVETGLRAIVEAEPPPLPPPPGW